MDLSAAVDQKVIRPNNLLLVTPDFIGTPKRKSDDTIGKVFPKTNVY
jgi:hypothetical protein